MGALIKTFEKSDELALILNEKKKLLSMKGKWFVETQWLSVNFTD